MQEPSHQDLIAIRRNKLDALRAAGIDPFGSAFDTTTDPGTLRENFSDGLEVRIAGRMTAHRDMGRSHFIDLSDHTGRIQVHLSTKELPEAQVEAFRNADIGDFLGVQGTTFTTRTGEPTVKAVSLSVLSKSLRPLPDKWHGVQDTEIKYRQRYLDLVANRPSLDVFKKRITAVREIRRFLEDRGYIEVETPMMQAIPGGAAAAPFKTHHNALGTDLYLRIAPELYLKRLLVGGFTRIFELNRNFRNEGVSRRHNPEFTMLEAYQAYADFDRMADLVEEMICHLAQTLTGSLVIEHRDHDGNVVRTIDLTRPWRRADYHDLVESAVPGWFELAPEARRRWCADNGIDATHCTADFEVTQHVFEKLVEEKTMNPLFVTRCPKELVPLARQNADNPGVVDVFELVINGQEIAPGYSELNDPDAQRLRLEEQSGGETQKLDADFLEALEHGMPPAGGIGIGIDRLVMMLTGAESIRDVILFPHMRPRAERH